jgi:hypothetical protein
MKNKVFIAAGMVVHTCNPSIQQAEAGILQARAEASPGYIEKSCLKKKTRERIWGRQLLCFFASDICIPTLPYRHTFYF